MRAEDISALIQSAMPRARVTVRGDDGAHFEAIIVAPDFRGLARLKRHQLVYAALGGAMDGDVHALTMQTLTPEEWADADA